MEIVDKQGACKKRIGSNRQTRCLYRDQNHHLTFLFKEFAKAVQEKEKQKYERYLEKKKMKKLKKEKEEIEKRQQMMTEEARLNVRGKSYTAQSLVLMTLTKKRLRILTHYQMTKFQTGPK